MIRADRTEDSIVLSASPRDSTMIKTIPGARYVNGVWTLPLSWSSALALRSTFGSELEISPNLAVWGSGMRKHHEDLRTVGDLEQSVRESSDPRLLPKQVEGTAFLLKAYHAVLGDEMRAGKSVMVASALRHLGDTALPALIVAPNSMVLKWADEIAEWAPGLRVRTISGTMTAQKRDAAILAQDFDVLVIGWATMWRHTRLAPYGSVPLTDKEKTEGALNKVRWETVIADEAHRALSPKAKQTRAIWHLMHSARFRWALTGTAVRNDPPTDVWGMGHLVAPYDFPVRSRFIDRYTLNGNNGFGFVVYGWNPALKEEALAIFDPHFIRRTFAEVMPGAPTFLPPDIRRIEMTKAQAKAYKDMKKNMMVMLDTGVLLTGDPLVQVTRLLQIASATPVLDSDGNVVSLDTPSSKMEAMLDIIDEDPGGSLVVFAASRKLIELAARVLDKEKISYVMLTGHTPTEERAESVARFQAGEAQIFLGTTGAGGEGITLNRANRLLFLQRPYSLPENLQAEARIGGIAQTRPMQVIDLLTEGTIEDSVLELVFAKEEGLQSVLRDPEWIRRELG